jgi:hypothetical protein
MSTRWSAHLRRRDPLSTIRAEDSSLSLQIAHLEVAQPAKEEEVVVRGAICGSQSTYSGAGRTLAPVDIIQTSTVSATNGAVAERDIHERTTAEQ